MIAGINKRDMALPHMSVDIPHFPHARRSLFFNENCFLILTVATNFFVYPILNMRNFSLLTLLLFCRVSDFVSFSMGGKGLTHKFDCMLNTFELKLRIAHF